MVEKNVLLCFVKIVNFSGVHLALNILIVKRYITSHLQKVGQFLREREEQLSDLKQMFHQLKLGVKPDDLTAKSPTRYGTNSV